MAKQYDNNNRFILSRNDRREKDTHPEFTGTITVDGVEYWMSAWVQERKDGSGKFFSGSIKEKEQQKSNDRQRQSNQNKRNYREELDDEIPF